MKLRTVLTILIFYAGLYTVQGQDEKLMHSDDSTVAKKQIPRDTLPEKSKKFQLKKMELFKKDTVHNPYLYPARQAAKKSAILPGWGQYYNKKYWKMPIVYGGLGTAAGIFIYNFTWYKRVKFAYNVLYAGDTSSFPKVHPKIKFLVDRDDLSTLGYLRRQFRRDIDYSALFFMGMWGLNVIDAAVDGHLSTFDVSPDLGMRLKIGPSAMAGTAGVNLVFKINRPKQFNERIISF